MYAGVEFSLDWAWQSNSWHHTKHGPREGEDIRSGTQAFRSGNTDTGLGSRILFNVFDSFLEYTTFVPSFGEESVGSYQEQWGAQGVYGEGETFRAESVSAAKDIKTCFILASLDGPSDFGLSYDSEDVCPCLPQACCTMAVKAEYQWASYEPDSLSAKVFRTFTTREWVGFNVVSIDVVLTGDAERANRSKAEECGCCAEVATCCEA